MVAEKNGSGSCAACPADGDCMWGPLAKKLAVPKLGHFRTDAGKLIRCPVGPACLGWDIEAGRNRCALGAGGYACQSCVEKNWRPHDQPRALCIDCTWVSWLRVFLVIALECFFVWVLAAMSVNASIWGGLHSVTLRLALNYLTAVSVVARLESWELEAYLGTNFAAIISFLLKILFRFDGGVVVQQMGLVCLFAKTSVGAQHHSGWASLKGGTLFWALAPIIWSFAFMLLGVVVIRCHSTWVRIKRTIGGAKVSTRVHVCEDLEPRIFGIFRSATSRARGCRQTVMALQDSVPLIVVAVFLCLPTVLRELVATLACERFPDGSRTAWRLLAHPEIVCWEGDHSVYGIFAVLVVVFWGVVVPLSLAVFLRLKRAEIATSRRLRVTWNFVSDGYEPRFAFWEGVVQLRRFVLVVIVGIWPGLTRQAELALYQVIGALALTIHLSGKPFDNRAGELLDRIEQYGLMLFLIIVSALQLVLLARLGARYDLLPALMTLTIGFVCILSFLGVRGIARILAVIGTGVAVLFVIGTWASDGDSFQRVAAFCVVLLAILINAAYMAWTWFMVFAEAHRAVAASIRRSQSTAKQKDEGASCEVTPGMQLALNTRHMLASSTPGGTLIPRPTLPETQTGSVFSGIRGVLLSSQSKLEGALIRFDVKTKELILGIDPATALCNPLLSAYAKRQLARLGPFLTDEERKFIAMGFKDALLYIIDDCDINPVNSDMLEFLIRTAFVWRYQKRSAEIASDGGGRTGDKDLGRVTSSKADKMSAQVVAPTFGELLFEDGTYATGMTAVDFQAELQRITTMSVEEVEALLDTFRGARSAAS
eukprot:TRINITY_DN30024_c0_g2_i1.p1 TRINITY_DN30024_c0_g2~~TRINITY_DN30024_c0_g2_i1.p1  ORF type:complete len:937 (-),score=113.32 TRINITY_DN30024_c0_g2_i1:94-2565(-)